MQKNTAPEDAPAPVEGTGAALPAWLATPQGYEPVPDREGFLTKSFLQLSGLLAQMRAEPASRGTWAPGAAVKLVCTLVLIVLVSLSRNFAFVLAMLGAVLVRACLLPGPALRRSSAVAAGAALLTFVVMLPAAALGQRHSPVLLGTKVLVTVGLTMQTALTVPVSELGRGLRRLHVPGVVILTLELTLRSLVDLGTVAQEALQALTLRSVGKNDDKAGSLAGVAGVTFVKAAQRSQQTYDAMRCRGFDGSYTYTVQGGGFGVADLVWVALTAAAVAAFAYLQQAV